MDDKSKKNEFSIIAKSKLDFDSLLCSIEKNFAVSISDKDGIVTSVNEIFLEKFQCNSDDIIGKSIKIFRSEFHPQSFWEDVWKRISSKSTWRGDVCQKLLNGQIVWFKTKVIPVLDDHSEIKCFLTIREDITDIKQQEEESWKQLQLQTYINNHSSNIIIRTDLSGEINYVNSAFLNVFGYSSFEILFVKKPDFFIQKDNFKLKAEEYKNSFKFETSDDFDVLVKKTKMLMKNEHEWDMVTKDQKIRCFKLNINYYYDQDQKPLGFIIIGIDISEKKELEKSIYRSKIENENILKLKSEFLSRLSHEIKTPLNGILGMVNILESTDLNTEQREYLDIIQTSSNRLLSLINKTIEFNKLEDDNWEINEKRFSITHIIFELNQAYRQIAKNLKINFEISNKLENDVYLGDEKRIYQILNYYLENAFKYTSEGSIVLTISNVNNEILFEVRDSGEGIEKEDQINLFKPHYASRNHFQGLGLSLAIVERIAKKMNASVGFKSSLGHGSLFTLKVALPPMNLLYIPEIENQKFVEFKDIKVLIVEDEAINQRLLKKILNKINIYPEVVSNGLEAIEVQKNGQYDLIFMDVNMPVMDGIESTKIMRSSPEIYGAPIIVAVTANSITGDEEICLKSGMNDYIPKPINRERLEKLLFKLVGEDIKTLIKSKAHNKFYYIQKVINDFKGDEDVLESFINDIVSKVPAKFELLKEDIGNNNFDGIEAKSHALGDLMKTIHQDELYDMFLNIELYGKKRKFKNIIPMISDLEKRVYQVLKELKHEFFKEAA